jgi:hypothetical protein
MLNAADLFATNMTYENQGISVYALELKSVLNMD